MFHNYLRKSRLCGGAIIIIAALGLPASAQSMQSISVPPMPGNIKAPDGNIAFMKAQAVGTQNYVCLPTATGFGWKFQGPQATLFLTVKWITGDIRQQIATHYLSPNPTETGTPARATWQHSLDTSAVWAKKIEESSDSNYVAAGAIPWFLLEVVGSQRGPTDGSLMVPTTYIQRVNTTGGIMPTTGCSEAGAIQFVPYTADYIFYKSNRSR